MENNKKVIIGSIIAVLTLVILTVGATYAYFRFASNNEFGTQTIEATTEKAGSDVTLTKVGEGLKLDVTATQMLEESIGNKYYASGSEESATIGKISVVGDGKYNCTYKMTITKSATSEETDLYNKFQNMSTKSEGQIYLNVNEEVYDFNTSNLFPIIYNGEVEVTNGEDKYITANLTLVNSEVDQTELNNGDIAIQFEIEEFNCEIDNEAPTVSASVNDNNTASPTMSITSNEAGTYCVNTDATVSTMTDCLFTGNISANSEITTSAFTTNGTYYAHVQDAAGNVGISSGVSITVYMPPAGEKIQELAPTGYNSTTEGGLYRFQGTSVNNYICFGTSNKSTCTGNTDAYMYRIIGINSSGQLKLIKNEALNTGIEWYSNFTTNITWPQSTIYSSINGSTFLTNTTYVSSGWSDKIATTIWKYGDNAADNTTASSLYNKENGWTNTVSAKIGLMYMHDYYYAYQSGGLNCSYSGGTSTTCVNAWMHLSKCDSGAPSAYEWTMSRYGFLGNGYNAWHVHSNGHVFTPSLDTTFAVRPVFYLTSDVKFVSGTGDISDPFIVE